MWKTSVQLKLWDIFSFIYLAVFVISLHDLMLFTVAVVMNNYLHLFMYFLFFFFFGPEVLAFQVGCLS